MSAHSPQHLSTTDPQFELKAGTFTLPLLRLLGTDMDAVARQLSEKVAKAGGFFHNAPVVIDLKEVAGADVEFPLLVGLMRGHGMIPVGVRGGTQAQNRAAEALELAVLADSRPHRSEIPDGASRAAEPVKAPPPPPPAPSATKLVSKPIRSGQRVYAPGGDLVVLAQVSSGAEIMADGHIHVYAALRGRALAGVKGNQEARIFCHDLQAELVSVAGHYRISENIDSRLRGRPVQIYLDDRTLHIEGL
jgi:septum site-determining protein MinC